MIRDNIYSVHKVRISNDDLGCVDNVRAEAGILSPVISSNYMNIKFFQKKCLSNSFFALSAKQHVVVKCRIEEF